MSSSILANFNPFNTQQQHQQQQQMFQNFYPTSQQQQQQIGQSFLGNQINRNIQPQSKQNNNLFDLTDFNNTNTQQQHQDALAFYQQQQQQSGYTQNLQHLIPPLHPSQVYSSSTAVSSGSLNNRGILQTPQVNIQPPPHILDSSSSGNLAGSGPSSILPKLKSNNSLTYWKKAT